MELDLQKFCSTDPTRPYLEKPFSHGSFTYATNEHIMVRLPRQDGIPEQTKEAKWDAPFKGFEDATFSPKKVKLPPSPVQQGDCEECEGRGTDHACPNCQCTCDACNGSGKGIAEKSVSTSIRGVTVALRYARMMLALPGIEIADMPKPREPMLFRFDGGIGALMPTNGEMSEHVEIAA